METTIQAIKAERYTAYKDSDVEWLGEIPEHWSTKRMKYICDYKKGRNPAVLITDKTDLVYLSMEYLRGTSKKTIYTKDLGDLVKVTKGDILLLWDGSNAGEFIQGKDGVLSSTMAVVKITHSVNKRFTWYFLKTIENELKKSNIGMGIPHVSANKFDQIPFLIPSITEQNRIANFLDHKTAQIDKAIAQKERLIELLKERRQVVIHQAVTQGLHPNVPMKDSGVEWIGKIPEHWKVRKLKHSVTLVSEKIDSKSEFQYIGMENIESWTGNYDLNLTETNGLANHFVIGDILFGKLRPYLAKVHLATFEGICSTEFLVFRYSNIIKQELLKLILLSSYFINLIDSSTYGSKMPRANWGFIGRQYVPIPPKNEQEKIFAFINQKSEYFDKVIENQKVEITKLKEFKQTVINSAVTGKIKV